MDLKLQQRRQEILSKSIPNGLPFATSSRDELQQSEFDSTDDIMNERESIGCIHNYTTVLILTDIEVDVNEDSLDGSTSNYLKTTGKKKHHPYDLPLDEETASLSSESMSTREDMLNSISPPESVSGEYTSPPQDYPPKSELSTPSQGKRANSNQ